MKRLKRMIVFSVAIGILAVSVCTVTASLPNPIPDTGETQSYTDTFGEDSDYTINPQSYTKLDSAGNELPDSASSWSMVKDNVTGLIWEVKTDDASIHDMDNTYTWDNAQAVFIAALNAENYGGFSDWRLPTVKELSFIVNRGIYAPAINTSYFTNTMSLDYWSSTTDTCVTSYAWCVYFDDGRSFSSPKYIPYYVRAVRGGQEPGPFMDNGDGTVTDTSTGLTWQRATAKAMTWEAAINYCEGLTLAGHDDWRLPDINELQSIADYARYNPGIDTDVFPDTVSFYYWSSTTDSQTNYFAWYACFYGGNVSNIYNKSSRNYVRAVRGAPNIRISYVPGDYSTIQAAIDAALPGDTVLVSDGIYTGVGNRDLDFKGKAISVKSQNGPENCIIDCEMSGRGVYFNGGEGADTGLSGFTIRNGRCARRGGGICCSYSSPTITNCTISDNHAYDTSYSVGGGICCYYSSPDISNCTISYNQAGIFSNDPSTDVVGKGGGIYCYYSSPNIINCTISYNSAFGGEGYGIGGGIYCESSSPVIKNCTITDNTAYGDLPSEGGGFFFESSSIAITNCTISGNTASPGFMWRLFGDKASAIHSTNSSLSITNCILWNNQDEISAYGGSVVSHSDVQGGYPGENNIDADPLFVNPAAGDYHLLLGSPCMDKGTNSILYLSDLKDMDGRERPMDGDDNGSYVCDMGAYEFEGPTLIELDQFTAVTQNNQSIIKWNILSELDNAGFNLWRSESKNGKYIRINSKIIDAKGGTTQKAEYAYSDDTVKPGVRYYYKLEDIDTRGVSTFHGPVSAMISSKPSKTAVEYYLPY